MVYAFRYWDNIVVLFFNTHFIVDTVLLNVRIVLAEYRKCPVHSSTMACALFNLYIQVYLVDLEYIPY